jgi:hypothetical protein
VHYYKFPQQFYCPFFSISLFDFFIVIARSDAAKLVANRYSVWLSRSQNAITLISNTDSSTTKQPWLSSNMLKFWLFFRLLTKNFCFLHNSLILSWLEKPLSIIPTAFSGIKSTVLSYIYYHDLFRSEGPLLILLNSLN